MSSSPTVQQDLHRPCLLCVRSNALQSAKILHRLLPRIFAFSFLEIIFRLLHGHEIASLMILFLTSSYTQPSYTQPSYVYTQPSYTQPSEASASPASDEAAQSSRVGHFVKSPTPCSARPWRVKTRTLGISSNDVFENLRDVTYM
jgi:hypothetical protein